MGWILVFALAGIGSAAAQTRPDFSGSWKLNVGKSDIQEVDLRGALFEINHHDPDFVISRKLVYATETNHLSFAVKTDGNAVVVPYGDERLKVAIRWAGGSLLCSVRDVDDSEADADRVRYSLSPDGKTLVVTEHGVSKPRVWVFEKQ